MSPNNPCEGAGNPGHHGAQGSLVCIDWQTFTGWDYYPDPDPITAKKSNHVEFWFYNMDVANPPDMEVLLPGNLPVKKVICHTDYCTVDVKSSVARTFVGKYAIVDRNSGKYKDPDIIIEP